MPFGINLNDAYEQAANLVDKVTDVVEDVASDPIGFASDAFGAVGNGVEKFASNIAQHTAGAATEWLGNNLEDAGIDLPDDFSARSMLQLGSDVLGTTKDRLVDKAESVFGEKNLDAAQAVASKIVDIVTTGMRYPVTDLAPDIINQAPELIGRVAERLADLPEDLAIEDKLEFAEAVVDKVVELANPVGAIVVMINAKVQMIDAVVTMMSTMLQSQQRETVANTTQ